MILSKMNFLNSFLVLVIFLKNAAVQASLTIETSYGTLTGAWNQTESGRDYATFLGIPYANPPVGEYRFMDPEPLEPWSDTLNATEFSPACLQFSIFTQSITGVEDCLYLNVYSPNPETDALLPVIVFIPGGGLISGSSSQYDPIRVMDSDVVFVSINYRLGPLGFLSTEDSEVPGNAGLKDQTMALKWVKNEIVNFGGNPDSITLIGQSAGSACVSYHYLSSLSEGLFHRGIEYSGSAFAPWALDETPLAKAQYIAGVVGCPNDTTSEMTTCLKNATGEDIANAQLGLLSAKVHLFPAFGPVVEAENVTNPFMDQNPYTKALSGGMQKLPLVMTSTSAEGLMPAAAYLAQDGLLEDLEARWDNLTSEIFCYKDTISSDKYEEVAEKIKEYYLDGNAVSEETFSQLVQALGDRNFVNDVGKQAELHASLSGESVYMGIYSYRGNYSFSDALSNSTKNLGSAHLDDFLHICKALGLDSTSTGDVTMNKNLIQILVSFATNGVPTLPDGTEWTPITANSSVFNVLEIISPTEFEYANISTTDFGNRTFWNSLGFEENENA